MAEKTNVIGRPLKFDSAEELDCRINAYFDDCDKVEDTRVWSHDEIVEERKRRVCCLCNRPERSKGCLLVSGFLKQRRPYTVTGLAVWLDTSRQTLLEYEGEVEGRDRDPAFADTIKRAKQKIENYAEEKLFDGDYPTRGVIFSLSNNARGWAEKREDTVKVTKDGAAELAAGLLGEQIDARNHTNEAGETDVDETH